MDAGQMQKTPRPNITPNDTIRIHTGCGHLYVTVTFVDGKPFEVFSTLGKSGGCTKCTIEGVSRCISLGLRYGIPVMDFVDQLKGVSCHNKYWDNGIQTQSCVDGIARGVVEILESRGMLDEAGKLKKQLKK